MTIDTMVVDEIESRQSRGWETVSARIRTDRRDSRLWFRWNGAECSLPGDVFLLAAIQSAMQMHCHLRIGNAVSTSLLEDTPALQRHLQQTHPDLPTITIAAESDRSMASPPAKSAPIAPAENCQDCPQEPVSGAGVLFTGGIDAYYTLHKHREALESIVYMSDLVGSGEDVRNANTALQTARHTARELGMAFILVETNLRTCFSRFTDEGAVDHDMIVATLGAVLSGHLATLYLSRRPMLKPSAPSGSTPIFNPILSRGPCSDRVHFDYNGVGTDLEGKIMSIAGDTILLDAIRICRENPDRSYNCGKCATCTRHIPAYQAVESLGRR